MKQEWITALRSGEYKQTTDTLRDDKGFCCLGVLCDLVDPSGWDGEWYDGSFATPPKALIKKLGFQPNVDIPVEAENGGFYIPAIDTTVEADRLDTTHNGKLISIAGLNDRGLSFDKIADLLEIYL